ncbi:MAG: hypothetical protein AAB344_04395 [Bacteroidota bacterium]|jgi:hypothetical protein
MEVKTIDIVEIKSRIHEGVEAIEDADFLLALEQTINMKYVPPTEIVLTEEQHKALNRAEKQIERGEFLTSEELNSRIEKWLGK